MKENDVESKQAALKEHFVLNAGDCYFEVMKNEIAI